MPEQIIDSSVSTPGAQVISSEVPAGGTIDWRTSIPADLRSEKSLENVKDLPSLIKGYVESQKFIGGSVRIPGDNAKPEEVSAFLKKLGVPDNAAEYKVAKPVLPEYAGWNDTVHTQVLDAAHKAGLTVKQTQKIVEGLSAVVMGISPDPQKVLEESKTTLQKDWGENFNRNILLSSRAVDHLAQSAGMKPEDLHKALAETGAGAHPVVLKAFAQLGNGMLEQGLIKSEETRLETVTDAQNKLKAMRDMKHPYMDANHPQHADAVDEYRRLLQIIEANK